ncbi:hypothetical protein MBLNU230_g6898t1 [Neophaeotheca triangularis]
MATQAAMGRQPYPPISSYQTPQSNSPASIQSPQHDAHGRPLYGMPPMAQQMYYQPYQMQQQSPYGPTPPSSQQQPPMTSAPGMMASYQQQHHQQQPHQQQPHQQSQQPPQAQGLPNQHQHQHQHHAHPPPPPPPMIDTKPSAASLQRPPSALGPHGTPQTPQAPGIPGMPPSANGANPNAANAAPGPIPATTPLVVRQDNNGVQWIAFEYSRDRVKMEYQIRCDVESVNVEELSPDFKNANCVYPRACCGKDQYKGNRLHYESECNAVGWALAQLNPNLREKRGLIQRAVDSWRNSNQDPRLRSRRVRRMAKMHTRKSQGPGSAGQMPGPPTPGSAGLGPPGMPTGSGRPPNMGPGHPMHHQNDGSEDGDNVSAGNEYHLTSAHQHQHQTAPNGHEDLPSPTAARYAQSFYPTHPAPQHPPGAGAATLPPAHNAMDSFQSRAPTLTASRTATVKDEEDEESRRALFGDVPESKRRKFILVEDQQRGTRVRVRVLLENVKMDDMPDSHLRSNAVYPRSYFPRQMRSPPGSPASRWDDEDDTQEGVSGTLPTRGKTLVPVQLMDGSDTKLPMPRMTKSRRNKEVALNELGYRMAWGQARTFSERTLFLQRSLDAYRNKMRSTMISAGQGPATIAPHFETRPGKRKWLERTRHRRRAESP